MRRIWINRIFFILLSLLFVFSLPFGIYERYILLLAKKLSKIDTIIFIVSFIELSLYILGIILFLKKSKKTIPLFNLAISLTLLFIIFDTIFKIINSHFFVGKNTAENVGRLLGFLTALGLPIYFIYLLNKFGLYKKIEVEEIENLGNSGNL